MYFYRKNSQPTASEHDFSLLIKYKKKLFISFPFLPSGSSHRRLSERENKFVRQATVQKIALQREIFFLMLQKAEKKVKAHTDYFHSNNFPTNNENLLNCNLVKIRFKLLC